MIYHVIFAAAGLFASSVMASTPQGYGYGGVTDSLIISSTESPETLSSSIVPVTITDSVTITKPVTITHTQTVTVSPDCGDESGSETTTIYSTTRTTRTTSNTIFISIHPTPHPPPQTFSGFSESSSSEVTSVTSTASASTTGYVVSNTTTPCESETSTGDVDGVTGSLSTTSMSTITLAIPPSLETTSEVISGTAHSTTGVLMTRTLTSTIPISTIPTSMGLHSTVNVQFLAGAMGLVFLVFALAL
ncbi:hypothetical protein NPX13_g7481 [Xylaria arbuscula]|uniref:Uncharacterized protein n=1 Tax=Xylaria arbuscula TaxID=114810 RepID=A0A9W8NA92_9PEZI|nr:hypothetical protein NPX13_g7481 [Xylaria arbuscula]